MDALGRGGFWGWNPFLPQKRTKTQRFDSKSASDSVQTTGNGAGFRFPLKQAATAGSLALSGDTIAQLSDRWTKSRSSPDSNDKDIKAVLISKHDWVRAFRMASYGFLLYGPGSYAWYQYLDHCLPQKTVGNLMLKVLLNQIVLGPAVIAVVFAWNNLWQGKLSELPRKYRKDALPTLLTGFRVVPLQARVAFMSIGSIFWNFYLSLSMSK